MICSLSVALLIRAIHEFTSNQVGPGIHIICPYNAYMGVVQKLAMILLMKLSKVNAKCSRSDHIEARFCRLLQGYASEAVFTLGLDAAAFDRAAAKSAGPEAAVGKEQVGSLYSQGAAPVREWYHIAFSSYTLRCTLSGVRVCPRGASSCMLEQVMLACYFHCAS